jgi:HAD superfamily hydrolase (TIGR01509 family)
MMKRKNRYYKTLIEGMTPADLIPGGRELLHEIRERGMKTAVASSSKNSLTVLRRLDIIDLFDGIADGYCVVNGKPAPDIFVYAAGLVRVYAPNCLGVEDADAGIEAIKNAGMRALAVGPRERFHRADAVLPTLANLTLTQILRAGK